MSVGVKSLCASVSAVLILSGSVLVAQGASADSVWVQSYERSSQAEVCAGQPGETVWQESWSSDSSWSSSWEQWANGGNGGWTCSREITWARTPSEPSAITTPAPAPSVAGCVMFTNFGTRSVDFGGTNFLPAGAIIYTNTTCNVVELGGTAFPLAYAISSAAANAICSTQVPGTVARTAAWTGTNIYYCEP